MIRQICSWNFYQTHWRFFQSLEEHLKKEELNKNLLPNQNNLHTTIYKSHIQFIFNGTCKEALGKLTWIKMINGQSVNEVRKDTNLHKKI